MARRHAELGFSDSAKKKHDSEIFEPGPFDSFGRRHLPPVGLAHEDDPARAQALRQKRDRARDTATDPRSADTGCYPGLLVGDVARRIAVDELDLAGDTEFFSAAFCLLGEQLAQVDAGADDAVITCPGAQVHSISPEPLPRSSTRVPFSRRSAAPSVASFSGVNGLWMR
jgi:hypothetical protein